MSADTLRASAFAQFLWREGLRERRSVAARLRFKLMNALRSLCISTSEPLIEYTLDGTPLLLPMSHSLPLYRRDHPQYSSNVGRIAAAAAKALPDFTFVDIGANVGDTLAIVRAQAHFPVLCIEGAEQYVPVLRANAAQFDNVEIEPCFVGAGNNQRLAVAAGAGTARLVAGASDIATTNSLRDILARHPRFATPGMIKLDTDGMDTLIIKHNVAFLASQQPLVFFEYDPYYFAAPDEDGFGVFEVLRAAGYGPALIYSNLGDLICRTHLQERELLRDLHEFYSGRSGHQYCDLCVFPEKVEQLCGSLHASELNFFREFRAREAGGAIG